MQFEYIDYTALNVEELHVNQDTFRYWNTHIFLERKNENDERN